MNMTLSERQRLGKVFYEAMRHGYEYRQRKWKQPWDKLYPETRLIFADAAAALVDELRVIEKENVVAMWPSDKQS
jgi:hypothetical protein